MEPVGCVVVCVTPVGDDPVPVTAVVGGDDGPVAPVIVLTLPIKTEVPYHTLFVVEF